MVGYLWLKVYIYRYGLYGMYVLCVCIYMYDLDGWVLYTILYWLFSLLSIEFSYLWFLGLNFRIYYTINIALKSLILYRVGICTVSQKQFTRSVLSIYPSVRPKQTERDRQTDRRWGQFTELSTDDACCRFMIEYYYPVGIFDELIDWSIHWLRRAFLPRRLTTTHPPTYP